MFLGICEPYQIFSQAEVKTFINASYSLITRLLTHFLGREVKCLCALNIFHFWKGCFPLILKTY